ncbi:MAG: hypothetical protein JST86_11285 [Bacteroidetes bacterium]|nr:hypothetical protein [Bacteroidota bacterium]
MKKILFSTLFVAAIMTACQKSNSGTSSISLSASTTTAAVGQTVTVTASTNVNALSWTATPAASTTEAYGVTTEKTNYFTFSQPGDYVVGVRARGLDLDSVHVCNHADSSGHYFADSLWNHHVDSLWHVRGNHLGGCRIGQDSASIIIKVK